MSITVFARSQCLLTTLWLLLDERILHDWVNEELLPAQAPDEALSISLVCLRKAVFSSVLCRGVSDTWFA